MTHQIKELILDEIIENYLMSVSRSHFRTRGLTGLKFSSHPEC